MRSRIFKCTRGQMCGIIEQGIDVWKVVLIAEKILVSEASETSAMSEVMHSAESKLQGVMIIQEIKHL